MGFHYNGSCFKCQSRCLDCFYAVFENDSPPKINHTKTANFTILTDEEARNSNIKMMCGTCTSGYTVFIDLLTCVACAKNCTECYYTDGKELIYRQIYLMPNLPTEKSIKEMGTFLRCSNCLDEYSIDLNFACIQNLCDLENCLVCQLQPTQSIPIQYYYTCLRCYYGYTTVSYENNTLIPPYKANRCRKCTFFFESCEECTTQSFAAFGTTSNYACTLCEADKVLHILNFQTECVRCERCIFGMCSAISQTAKVISNNYM
jgi:hypothetical protein